MRISGGKSRGITLRCPRGQKTRPAADAVREALFSSLGSRVEACRFVDLFAGTGAYGLEAWSRGAAGGTFVEYDFESVRCIKENMSQVAKSANLDDSALELVRSDVFRWQAFEEHAYDIVFADPPYASFPQVAPDLFNLGNRLLKKDGMLVVEKPADLELDPVGWILVNRLGKKRGSGPSVALWMRESFGDLDSQD
ncbi:MAG: 16S rRNA (guanine(966)-N(2))-methyltransferase RsmD [Verrucomicrobia bacterium]|nr:16S rRNA (guanine(966)-N(2))-methyltransferase RsmD [Verrucomicrobiota bacterium]